MKKFRHFSLLLALMLVVPIYAQNVLTEIISPTQDSYVKFDLTDKSTHGGETNFTVKYNGSEFGSTSRQGLIEYDFTPYLNNLSRISSLQFCIRVDGTYTPGTPAGTEPSPLTLNVQTMSGFTFTESQANDAICTAYETAGVQNSGVTTQLVGSTTFPTDKNYSQQEYAVTIDVQKVLALVTSQNPKVIFAIKATASKAMTSPILFATKEHTDATLRPYMRVGVSSVNPYIVNTISDPTLDTFCKNSATNTNLYGTANLDSLRGGSSANMSVAIIQFDFSSYSTQLATARAINLGLNMDFLGDNGGIPNSLVNIFSYRGITVTEAMTNNQVLTAYNARTNGVFLGTVAIPTATTTATDFKFELNKNQLLAVIAINPVITFVVKSAQDIPGAFRFATKENTTRTHPYIQILTENAGGTTNIESTKCVDKTIFLTNNNLRISNLNGESKINIYNQVGQLLYSGVTTSDNIILPVNATWGRFLVVNVNDKNGVKTVKICN